MIQSIRVGLLVRWSLEAQNFCNDSGLADFSFGEMLQFA